MASGEDTHTHTQMVLAKTISVNQAHTHPWFNNKEWPYSVTLSLKKIFQLCSLFSTLLSVKYNKHLKHYHFICMKVKGGSEGGAGGAKAPPHFPDLNSYVKINL